ncbi:MAG: SDR family oxidoreductase [Gammaproteobacteria bacterium]|uniref:SDR family NAD(P)-dependent oxidoreductase n=1 Tax=Pseudomaricurvus alcaniphilus TaxID=1166482 RepID=UPI00140A326A|nr:SDR family oxidoreductase [Pseudomaricurvus alcaniphilus]MBR9910626.1 SDR family oxidoreductase [Gammaproteobacteria bacterium]NHN36851.1 SDR family oxidoreductase [Pseudomaricurvus alcaniphilus]
MTQSGIIITGGAQGIGRACAEILAEAGRPVAIWDLNAERATQTAAEIAANYRVTTCVATLDIADTAQYARHIDTTRSALGSIGGLVHAAGISQEARLQDLTEVDWDRVQNINLRSYTFLIKALLPDLRAAPGAAVVGIASINGILGNGLIPAYTVSKAGIMALTRCLADSLGVDGIRINAICPGYIRTQMSQRAFDRTEGLEQHLTAQTMLKRIGEPWEIATTARFLLSKDASYITGQSIVVDAGATISQL